MLVVATVGKRHTIAQPNSWARPILAIPINLRPHLHAEWLMPIEHPTRLHSPTLVACHLARWARLLAGVAITQWLSHTRHAVTPGGNLQSAVSYRNVIGAICQMLLAIIIFVLLKNLPIRQ